MAVVLIEPGPALAGRMRRPSSAGVPVVGFRNEFLEELT